MRGTILFKT